jgi:hypothetical protein
MLRNDKWAYSSIAALVLIGLAVLMSGCASSVLVKNCERIGQNVYECEEL